MSRPQKASRGRRGDSQFVIAGDPVPSWFESKARLEQWLLKRALAESDGNMAEAARQLGITKVAVLHAVRRHGLESHVKAYVNRE